GKVAPTAKDVPPNVCAHPERAPPSGAPPWRRVEFLVANSQGRTAKSAHGSSRPRTLPSMIHPTAVIHPRANVPSSTVIGPYAVIDEHVRLGEHCVVGPHAYLTGHTIIGARNRFYSGCVIGEAPQDLKYKNAPTRLRIG